MMRRRTAATPALLLLLGGCAYFNSMYNARQRFADAQRAAARGDVEAARAAYRESIDKAARSYRAHPDSRWADDALLLVGRARFELGEYDAAAAAMQRLLSHHGSAGLRAPALAFLGAASTALGRVPEGAAALDSAAASALPDGLTAFVALWRARAAFATGDAALGWNALDSAAAADGPIGLAARLERGARAVARSDSARARAALADLLLHEAAAGAADSVAGLARAAGARFGAAFARSALEPVLRSPWPPAERLGLTLERAAHAAAAADTATAIADASRVAELATGAVAAEARFRTAEWRLSSVRTRESMLAVSAALMPAAAHDGARRLLHWIAVADALLEIGAARAQPIALFAAAELARDSLRAPLLAKGLFLAYADSAAAEPWSGKALLAALQLSSGEHADSLRARIDRAAGNVYLSAVRGSADHDAFAAAEQRLDRQLMAMRFDAVRAAERRASAAGPAGVDRAALASADSVRRGCPARQDTIAPRGTRADTTAACVRRDSVRLAPLRLH